MPQSEDGSDDLPLLYSELSEKDNGMNCWIADLPQRRRMIILASLLSFFATTSIMLGILAVAHRVLLSQPLLWEYSIGSQRPGTVSCGTSTAEAVSRGCMFDELQMSWMPQKCTRSYRDQYMVANDGGPFLYWIDRTGKELLDDPSLHAGNGSIFWTSRRNHIVHCQYNLYRLADVLRSGDYIGHDDGQTLSDHMHHCVMTMAEYALKAPAHQLDVTDIITEAGFAYC
ncbi:hypothetical protein AUEXF2481DRAFT_45078 [Aureobasidium subglaciale EXF-2481]|uniref:Uncharacterized protein n=1 Tax=Aureobasidium subglaciale (strain EXF-2481) TaxID=1043005 RepID=A0A074Y3K2_AURSE|nr:uncharacterized protein AUEXF2481DRAFT_45078 [Aureobasidium subglaciale EXF-2481]KEQ90519.1 hypothetical protein AUEXF2481DRAFT_45078 [Aureobasidium subglaciale EXF-2481]